MLNSRPFAWLGSHNALNLIIKGDLSLWSQNILNGKMTEDVTFHIKAQKVTQVNPNQA